MTSDELLAHLTALEVLLHQRDVRSDPARLGALLHDEFREFGRSGQVWTRQTVLDEFTAAGAAAPDHTIHAEAFALTVRSGDLALLTYRSAHRLVTGELDRWTLRSSLWQCVQGQWVMRFHQGTACDDGV
jgi:hypothetical protein